jgi:hypothetical protein
MQILLATFTCTKLVRLSVFVTLHYNTPLRGITPDDKGKPCCRGSSPERKSNSPASSALPDLLQLVLFDVVLFLVAGPDYTLFQRNLGYISTSFP